ncbi:Transposase DDE domain [Vibrio sp. B1REV9]|nr:Transposase DDE domain [Vibrio sp. B1REV9]CAE6965103.1 Transposase DDE domain [Vibrio sp. B1REV9]
MGMVSPSATQKGLKDCNQITDGEVVAINCKTVRGLYNKSEERSAIHMVSAFSAVNQTVLGQVKTGDKTNEIKAIPELLELLSIRGCLVTIDAMGCQKNIANKIRDKGSDYLLAVKGNQKALNQVFHSGMLQQFDGDQYVTQEKGHGRLETRLSLVEHDMSLLGDIALEWPGLKTVGVVVSIRQEGSRPAETCR